ncbi:hypothetical protein RRG08_014650 [Elysia crispata]|uniref:Uncharacterized protein n=1 Tax=Elysia crispata TaxID=231223 RepID=A0AAE1CZN2_9GAST|nr:hypothetical protein RRG08_014650 [Elysia crispata]
MAPDTEQQEVHSRETKCLHRRRPELWGGARTSSRPVGHQGLTITWLLAGRRGRPGPGPHCFCWASGEMTSGQGSLIPNLRGLLSTTWPRPLEIPLPDS